MRPKRNTIFCMEGKKVNHSTLRNAITTPEIFIILLIIAFLAALSAPRFSDAQARSKLTKLVSSLEVMRQQIELYKIQHNGLLPGQKEMDGEITEEDFVEALTESDGTYGPYLRSIPENPFNDINSVRIGSMNLGAAAGAGWFFNSETGDFRADDMQFHRAY